MANKVFLVGRLTKDPDVRYSQGDNAMAIARFTVAVDRKFKKDNEPTADFISCVAFGKTAEFLEKYCTKGTKLVIEGRWQTGSYKNKDDQTIYTNDCMVESLEFAESKASAEQNAKPQSNANDGFQNVPQMVDEENELPFDI